MKSAFGLFLAVALSLTVWSISAASEQDKEVTIKGSVTCAKCELMKETKCATVVVEKKDKMETIYYFDTAGHKKYHSQPDGGVCTTPKAGSVTGVVSEKDGKKTITVKEVKYDSK